MSMTDQPAPPSVEPRRPERASVLDRLTIQGIVALTISFGVIGLTLVCVYAKIPTDGPTVGIISGAISGLLTLLGIIVKHFYDSSQAPAPPPPLNPRETLR